MEKNKETLIAILFISIVSFLIMSPQIYKHSIILGNDSNFHMNRIYEIYMQIKNNTYNYFQSMYGFQQYGRIVNALYSPDFSFLQALLLLITKNWFRFQLISSFLSFCIAGITMYSLGRFCKIQYSLSLIMSFMYMSTTAIGFYSLW